MSFEVGAIRITPIHEQDMHDMRGLIPAADVEAINEIAWLKPHYATDDGVIHGVVQAFVVETTEHLIVVDTCVGDQKDRLTLPEWNQLQSGFMERFRSMGFDPEKVSHVLCTHLHVDHVGWNTRWTGRRWVPTFPNANYLFADVELEFWEQSRKTPPPNLDAIKDPRLRAAAAFDLDMRQTHIDSMQPIFDAGLAQIVPTDHRLSGEVSLLPTPGHTPGHVAILLESQNQRAIITGDCIHHPCQIANPDWFTVVDADQGQGISTRQILLSDLAASGGALIGTHFAPPAFGEISKEENGFKFSPGGSEE